MSCKEKFKELFLKCDIFSTSEFLRYNEEPEYRTYTGAFCSVVTVLIFCGIFMNVMISTFAKTEIIWSLNTMQVGADEFSVTTQIQGHNKFMFALSISEQNLNNDTERKFDAAFLLRTKFNTISQPDRFISLEPCTPKHWNVSNQFIQIYKRMSFQKMLCPPIGLQIPLQGKFSSEIFKYSQIRILKCNATGNSSKTCANESKLQNKTFYFNVYFLNTLINPQSKDYISYYIQDRNYIQFTTTYTSLVNMFISNYQITTDESITPVKNQRSEEGALITNLGQVVPRQSDGQIYANFVLRRASTTLIADRSFKRVDDTLSYIGGLFGFALIFLLFMKEYTEYSYEIDASCYLYSQDQTDPGNPPKYNLLIFIAYLFYILLGIFGVKPKWKTMEDLDDCREEIQKQLDVRFLFERINFVERSLNHLFNQNQSKFLHLLRKPTLKQASKIRRKYQLKSMLMQNGEKNEQELTENPLENTSIIEMPNKDSFTNKVYPDHQEIIQTNHLNEEKHKKKDENILFKMKNHFKILHKDTLQGDHISRKIIEDLDPNIIKIIYQAQNQDASINNENAHYGSIEKLNVSARKKQNNQNGNSQINNTTQIIWNENEIIERDQKENADHTFEFVN